MKVSLGNLSQLTNRYKAGAVKVAQNSIMRLGGKVVFMSPVDTGRFRSNWLSAFGAADTSTSETFSPSGAEPIGRLKAELDGFKSGQSFYFTNSLPYAEKLEYGSSEQAPMGMIRASVVSWQSIVADEVSKVR